MNKWRKRILIVLAALSLNLLGRYIAFAYELPAYLDLCGTILAAYLEGPAAGIAAAALSCAGAMVFSPSDWCFLIADISVAVASGLIAKKNRYFSKFALIISATAFFAVVRSVFLLGVNLIVYGGKSGFYITDGVIDYLGSLSAPVWLRYAMAAVFISFTDALAAMLLIYLGMSILRNFGKRKRAAELKRQIRGRIAHGLILTVVFASVYGSVQVHADESVSFIERLYNSENGLTGGCLNDIAMTRDGSMWIGTYGGLFRFNGSRFVLMDNLQSVRSVQSLFVDEDDRLWAGTQDAGVTLLNIDMSWRTLDMSTGLPSNSVKCISRDSNGLYYFGTTAGISVAEYEDGEVRIIKTAPEAGNIKDMSPDNEGNMIVMNNLGEISCYENGDQVAKLNIGYATPKGIRHNDIGELYIGTDSEEILIYKYDLKSFRKKGTRIADGMKSIRDFYFDESGITYVAADNGIGYIDRTGRFTLIETGEFNNSIDHIFKDYQGNLWFTSSRCGLMCLGKSCFTDVFKLCNEKSIVCNAIKQWNGQLYVGSNNGLKILDIGAGESIKNDVTECFDGIRVRSMDIDEFGSLLVATYDKGLMEITAGGKVSAYVSTAETDKMVRVVCALSDGTVISSSDAGMVFMKDHKVMGRLLLGSDLGGGTVLNILETDDHTLFCGTDGDGIAVIKDRKLKKYISRDDGLSSGVVLRVVKDPNGDGYIVLTGSGLCYMERDLSIREIGMPYYNNFDIAMNSEGEIFVLGGAGIYISEYDALMSAGSMETYTLLDTKAGLPGSITSNAWNYVTEDEHIYICGTCGVYLLDLNNYEMKVDEFRTKITSIKRDGVYEDVTQFSSIFIPKGTDKIEFDLEINNYTAADPYVSYYLSGVDEEKTTVLSSKLGSVTYYDIPYGDHDFVINVTDEKGRMLSTRTYVFSKEMELYETTAFKLYFYFLLFTFIAFIVISIVQGALWSQQIKEKGRHELVVSQLEREKAEAMQRALHMEEDANRTKSEFLANMSHEIKTPINTIIGMDTMIMRESGEENIKGYARDIEKAGKKLLTLIDNVIDYSIKGAEPSGQEAEEEQTAGEKSSADEEAAVRAVEISSEKERFHAPEAKILIVDDVEMNLSVVRSLLKRTEVQLKSAMSGEAAVELAGKERYDIILIESVMQGMNGEETMRSIRTQCPLNEETPVIVMTTNAAEGAREEYFTLGYTNYLSKPLEALKLEAMIQSYLPDEKIILVSPDGIC